MLEDTGTHQPDVHLVKSPGSSVQAVGPVVEEQLILLPLHGEPPLRNPVGNTTHDGTEEGVLPRVTWPEKQQVVKPKDWDRMGWSPGVLTDSEVSLSASHQY